MLCAAEEQVFLTVYNIRSSVCGGVSKDTRGLSCKVQVMEGIALGFHNRAAEPVENSYYFYCM